MYTNILLTEYKSEADINDSEKSTSSSLISKKLGLRKVLLKCYKITVRKQ